jgi:hypothetical protein
VKELFEQESRLKTGGKQSFHSGFLLDLFIDPED